jgi:uncharacterized protein YeaO (DUF488 family)
MIRCRRAYEPPAPEDGCRVLVDRIWPRGQSRQDLGLDEWRKEAAPSNGLRRWFGHDPARWDEFRRRYFAELDAKPASWRPILDSARTGTVTLVYGARDETHNQAVALQEYLQRQLHEE